MGCLDLSKRLTTDRVEFQKIERSDESSILVERGKAEVDNLNSMDLHLGGVYYKDGKYFKIPDKGLLIRRRSGLVAYTKQLIGLPMNVSGIVVGKGKLIYQGIFISCGKLNPGFKGPLRIGLFNSGNKDLLLPPSATICSCLFFTRESEAQEGARDEEEEEPPGQIVTWKIRCLDYCADKAPQIVTAICAVITVVLTIINFTAKK